MKTSVIITRPAVSEKPQSLTSNGSVRFHLQTRYRDGTTRVIFEPLDFIARLAAQVPKPWINLIGFHWVFAFVVVFHAEQVISFRYLWIDRSNSKTASQH